MPVSQYCQRRILRFPESDRAFYRTKHDARARSEYEQASRKHSLEGMAQIVGRMLATSYGGKAMLSLGDSALDLGHYLEALEYYLAVRDIFPDKDLHTPELTLKIALCRKMLGDKAPPGTEGKAPGALSDKQRARFKQLIAQAGPEKHSFHSQCASAPHSAADDYTLFPPTEDPKALTPPVWKVPLPGTRTDHLVYYHPVVTDRSVIYRHKNIIYCRSILSGSLRWKCDIGGRVTWQSRGERQYPNEDLLVQDGLVFTPMYKVGPSLVALDETTGQVKWAYGPMAAGDREVAKMRFEAAPAGGPRTIYAGYVLDEIEGETHTDSEYGLIAFESTTGRVRWRRKICRLRPGKFSSGFAVSRRNRIRSFTSPPLYHQGSVYYNTNAGAVASIDALSGRVKWVMRYPYYLLPQNVHDATIPFGGLPSHGGRLNPWGPHSPMFWATQAPLLIGERLFALPVDSPFMYCIDRRSGKVQWVRRNHGGGNFIHLLGPSRSGHLVLASSNVQTVDPNSGKTIWSSPRHILPDNQPIMKHPAFWNGYRGILRVNGNGEPGMDFNKRGFYLAARPFITQDDTVYLTEFVRTGPYGMYPPWCMHLAGISLKDRKIVTQRRYYLPHLQGHTASVISKCKRVLPELAKWPDRMRKKEQKRIEIVKEVSKDSVPQNRYGPFMPFSRITFKRHGLTFELRSGCREIAMVYDQKRLREILNKEQGPTSEFSKAELAVGEARYDDAEKGFRKCLKTMSSEDVDFRALVNSQFYQVHKRLTQRGIRAARPDEELVHCLGMSRTATTLADEVQTLLALAEAYERKNDIAAAARCLQNVIAVYGHYEYPVPAVAAADASRIISDAGTIMDRAGNRVNERFFAQPMKRSLALLKRSLPLYFSAVSPLDRDLIVRAGELAASRLIRLQRKAPKFATSFESRARAMLAKASAEEQLYKLWEFPATPTSQRILDKLFEATGTAPQSTLAEKAALRKRLWRLSDVARVCALKAPEKYKRKVFAPPPAPASAALTFPLEERKTDLADARSTAWLVTNRRGNRHQHPDLMFLAGRMRKKLDNKFVLRCVDLKTGKTVWNGTEQRGENAFEELRLRGTGDEPGFFESRVNGDVVVVNGRYDVLAFNIRDGKLRWRFRVPYNFEIKHTIMNGDLIVLSGKSESVALYIPTEDPRGEVVWQEQEEGDVYIAPYFHGDRLVSVRKLPFNVTVRYRGTGKLIGRLALPDLSLHSAHPLVENGPPAFPIAHDGKRIIATDGWYYVAVDIEQMKIEWKRLIDDNDASREPPMRIALKGDYCAVLKQDYDLKAIYMLSSRTGQVLWRTDPKNPKSPQPIHNMFIVGGKLYGIKPHPGQGFYFTAMDCRTGKNLFKPREEKGYAGKPSIRLIPELYGNTVVALIKDRLDFEVKAFDGAKGKPLHAVKAKGSASFTVHGGASATVQNGKLVLLGNNDLRCAVRE